MYNSNTNFQYNKRDYNQSEALYKSRTQKRQVELSLFCPDEEVSNNQNRQHMQTNLFIGQGSTQNNLSFQAVNTSNIEDSKYAVNSQSKFNENMCIQSSNSVLQDNEQILRFGIDDDKLTIKIDGKDHEVDSIVQFKKTATGISQFRLAMCCVCCKSRLYWYQKPKIDQYGNQALKDLSQQVEDMYKLGIDIESQKTNEQLDDEEEDQARNDAPMCVWDADLEYQQNIVKQKTDFEKTENLVEIKSNQTFQNDLSKCSQEDLFEIHKLNQMPNDSIADNRSQTSVHDDSQNIGDAITNVCFDLDFIDDEDASMICEPPYVFSDQRDQVKQISSNQLMLNPKSQQNTYEKQKDISIGKNQTKTNRRKINKKRQVKNQQFYDETNINLGAMKPIQQSAYLNQIQKPFQIKRQVKQPVSTNELNGMKKLRSNPDQLTNQDQFNFQFKQTHNNEATINQQGGLVFNILRANQI